MKKETLYYDGACPLCAREMKHLAKLKRDSLDLVDIHKTDITNEMPSKEDMLLNLHLKRGDELKLAESIKKMLSEMDAS